MKNPYLTDPTVYYWLSDNYINTSNKGEPYVKIKLSELTYDRQKLVDDLMNSSYAVQRWDDNKRLEYYTRVVTICYALSRKYNKNIFTKIKEKFLSLIGTRTWDWTT